MKLTVSDAIRWLSELPPEQELINAIHDPSYRSVLEVTNLDDPPGPPPGGLLTIEVELPEGARFARR